VTTEANRVIDHIPSETLLWIRLGETSGWDVLAAGGEGEQIVGHFEDWHRLERTMARFGHALPRLQMAFCAS
jgi:hypothetical protein